MIAIEHEATIKVCEIALAGLARISFLGTVKPVLQVFYFQGVGVDCISQLAVNFNYAIVFFQFMPELVYSNFDII